MNVLTIIVAVYLILCMVRGLRRGLVKTVFSLIFFILVIATAALLTPSVNSLIHGSRNVTEFAEKQAEDFIDKQTEKSDKAGENGDLVLAIVGSALQVNGVKTVAAEKIADVILDLIGFAATLVISIIIWVIVEAILNHMMKKSFLGPVNRALGLIAGLFKGLLLVWVIFSLISVFQFTDFGGSLATQIRESPLLTLINRYNFVYRVISDLVLQYMNP